jgi:hypothetical protein
MLTDVTAADSSTVYANRAVLDGALSPAWFEACTRQ